jgi:hypothetical protein
MKKMLFIAVVVFGGLFAEGSQEIRGDIADIAAIILPGATLTESGRDVRIAKGSAMMTATPTHDGIELLDRQQRRVRLVKKHDGWSIYRNETQIGRIATTGGGVVTVINGKRFAATRTAYGLSADAGRQVYDQLFSQP